MVNITYHRDISRVTIEGHAKSGEIGNDLVCASVSILAQTLAAFVENMKEAKQTRYPTINIKEGDTVIDARPQSRHKDAVKLVFDSICAGFDLLAQESPEHVSFVIRGKI